MLLTPTSKVPERAVNVAGEAWLARPWAGENVGVRQRTALYRSLYSSKGTPPLHYQKRSDFQSPFLSPSLYILLFLGRVLSCIFDLGFEL